MTARKMGRRDHTADCNHLFTDATSFSDYPQKESFLCLILTVLQQLGRCPYCFTLNTSLTLSLSNRNLSPYFKLFRHIFSNVWSCKSSRQYYKIKFWTTETVP